MTFCKNYYNEHYPDVFNFEDAKERTAEKYFDKILEGKRERTIDVDGGKIKIEIRFERNGTFNHVSTWADKRDFFANDIDIQIDHAIYEELCNKAVVPFENGVPLGGWPQAGDIIRATYGNIIYINSVKTVDGNVQQKLAIMIPKKYERIAGGLNEVDHAT